MFTRTRLAAVAAAIAAMAAVPAVANASSVPLRGVVSGSPYGASNGQMAIPVLFSKITAHNAGLKSPVGVIIVKRTAKVQLPSGAGTTLPVNLRTGDRFKGVGDVNTLQQRVFYPRIVFSKPVVYFRSKELSLSELSAAVDQLRGALAGLATQLAQLRDGTIKAFQDVYQQLADLKAALAALKIPAGVDLSTIQSQIDALNKRIDDLIASLPDFSKFAKLTDLANLVQITDLTTLLSTNTVITTLQSQITNVHDQLQGEIDTLTANLNTVCNAIKNATVTLPAPLSTTIPVTIDTGGVC
jgi:prefoldin subunit 5